MTQGRPIFLHVSHVIGNETLNSSNPAIKSNLTCLVAIKRQKNNAGHNSTFIKNVCKLFIELNFEKKVILIELILMI